MDFLPVFVTGMFRSGTTLLARVLNAHPAITLASDPLLPLLKHLRDELATEVLGPGRLPPQAPLDDYFGDADDLALWRAVQSATLNRPLTPAQRAHLWPILRDYAAPFSQNLAARFDEAGGRTLTEAYTNLLRLAQTVYGDGRERVVGHKEVWADEFTPALHRSLPTLRSIHVVRDPRAVCASKNVAADKYPWLFLLRQWRKLAGLAWWAVNANPTRQRCLLVRYEDLTGEPEATARRICAFLDVPFDAAMLDGRQLRDGDDSPWQRNSSYQDLTSESVISSRGNDRWKRVLTPAQLELIEQLTFPVMQLFGYEPLTEPGSMLPDSLLLAAPEVTADELTGWIRGHVRVDPISTATLLAQENLRLRLLDPAVSPPSDLVAAYFHHDELYTACCEAAQNALTAHV